MDIRNCKRCGNMFHYNGNSVCNHCSEQEQQDFDKVRDYLFEHPNSPASEINQETGVEVKVITRFLKEGRLKMEGDGSDSLITCEKCGDAIQSGRYCEKCLQEMQSELKRVARPTQSISSSASSAGSLPSNPGAVWSQAKVHTYDHILKKKD